MEIKSKPRTCYCCGGHYKYCVHCEKDKDKPTWMFMFDTEKCKDVFNTCNDWTSGHLTNKQAQTALKKYDMSDTSMYHPLIQEQLKEIYGVKSDEPSTESDVKPVKIKARKAIED